MESSNLTKLLEDVHAKLCEILDINIPSPKIEVSKRSTQEKNVIYISERIVQRKYPDEKIKIMRIAGVIAHEDMHYILRRIYPFVDGYHKEWETWYKKLRYFLKLIDILDEFIATLAEFVIRYYYCRKLGIPLERLRKIYEESLNHFLEIELQGKSKEFKPIQVVGYILAYNYCLKNLDNVDNIIRMLKIYGK